LAKTPKPPKPPKPEPIATDDAAAKAKAEFLNQQRLRSSKGYAATNVRGNSLIGQFLKERTGSV